MRQIIKSDLLGIEIEILKHSKEHLKRLSKFFNVCYSDFQKDPRLTGSKELVELKTMIDTLNKTIKGKVE